MRQNNSKGSDAEHRGNPEFGQFPGCKNARINQGYDEENASRAVHTGIRYHSK